MLSKETSKLHSSLLPNPKPSESIPMKKPTATICLTIAVLLGSAGLSWSADFKKGLTAYKSGDFATALREWTPLVKQGNATAQNNLGLMYAKGQGVLQDYKSALKWFRLSTKQSFANAQSNLGFMYEKDTVFCRIIKLR